MEEYKHEEKNKYTKLIFFYLSSFVKVIPHMPYKKQSDNFAR